MEKILRQLIKQELAPWKDQIIDCIVKSKKESRYLTRKQVAQYLNIGLSTVDLWSRLGKLTKVKIDGSVRFDKEQIDALFNHKKARNEIRFIQKF